jgi:hypothetical protein
MIIKQGTATKHIPFFMVDSANHISGKAGLAPTVTISKNCGAFVTPAGAVTEIGSGWYRIAASATDSNTLGSLLVHAIATGADPIDDRHEVEVFDLDSATVTVGDKTGFSLAPEYNAAKTASSQASVDAVKIKVDNLPSDPASAAAINASFATVNSGISGIRGQTDKFSFVGTDVRATLDSEPVAIVLDSSDLIAIADAILKRDFSALTGEAEYSLLNAARMLRNVWDTTDGTLTVRKEDGATVAWTRELTTDPAAQPIVAAT